MNWSMAFSPSTAETIAFAHRAANPIPVIVSEFSHPQDPLALSLFALGLAIVVSLFVFYFVKIAVGESAAVAVRAR